MGSSVDFWIAKAVLTRLSLTKGEWPSLFQSYIFSSRCQGSADTFPGLGTAHQLRERFILEMQLFLFTELNTAEILVFPKKKEEKKVDLFFYVSEGCEKCLSKSDFWGQKSYTLPHHLHSPLRTSHVSEDVLVIFVVVQAFWTLGASTASFGSSVDHGCFFMHFCWCFGPLIPGVLVGTQAVSLTEKSWAVQPVTSILTGSMDVVPGHFLFLDPLESYQGAAVNSASRCLWLKALPAPPV